MRTSIVTTSFEPLLVRQNLFAYMFPGTTDGRPDRATIDALLPKVDAALEVLEPPLLRAGSAVNCLAAPTPIWFTSAPCPSVAR